MHATVIIALFALAAAASNWWSRWRSHQGIELVSKPAATIALAALAFASADDAPSNALVVGLIGFAFCLIGDVALLPAIDRFVVGLGAFLVGHLAFVVMFVMLGLDAWWLGLIALVAVAAVTAFIGSNVVAGATAKDPKLATPVKAYLAVISSMAVFGWSSGIPAAIVGSSLFVLSDSILGWRQFVTPKRWMPMTIMITYHAALAGLALSLAG